MHKQGCYFMTIFDIAQSSDKPAPSSSSSGSGRGQVLDIRG